MTNFYTGNGDDGKTSLLGGGRIDKYDLRLETLGTLDELSASLGLARSLLSLESYDGDVVEIQRKLYQLMTEVASTRENKERFQSIGFEVVSDLEEKIERISANLEPLDGFIIPGDSTESAAFALARTITRRAERRSAELLARGDDDNPVLLSYLNRLSSFLYVMEILLIQEDNGKKPTAARKK